MSETFDFFGNQFEIQKSRDIKSHTMHVNQQHHRGCYMCFGRPRRKIWRRSLRTSVRSFIDQHFNTNDFGAIGEFYGKGNLW